MSKDKIKKSDQVWKQELTPEQYKIARQKGTEMPFTGKYNAHKEEGIYRCVCCGTELFSSDAKFDSGSGWPSYYQVVDENSIKEITDKSHGMMRTEVMCNACEAHLGHVFNDGPDPTGLRYCINSASLDFKAKK